MSSSRVTMMCINRSIHSVVYMLYRYQAGVSPKQTQQLCNKLERPLGQRSRPHVVRVSVLYIRVFLARVFHLFMSVQDIPN